MAGVCVFIYYYYYYCTNRFLCVHFHLLLVCVYVFVFLRFFLLSISFLIHYTQMNTLKSFNSDLWTYKKK